MEKSLKPIDSNLKDKCIAYCPELPFGILSPCLVVILILKQGIFFSDRKITEKLSVIQEEMILPSFLKYVCQLMEEYIKQK